MAASRIVAAGIYHRLLLGKPRLAGVYLSAQLARA